MFPKNIYKIVFFYFVFSFLLFPSLDRNFSHKKNIFLQYDFKVDTPKKVPEEPEPYDRIRKIQEIIRKNRQDIRRLDEERFRGNHPPAYQRNPPPKTFSDHESHQTDNHSTTVNQQVPNNEVNSNQTIPESAIVIMYCHDTNPVQPGRFGIPAFELKCQEETNRIDCHEAVPYLQFIYDHYDNPPAKKIIFIHGHVFGWHYKPSIYDTISNLLRTKEYYEMDYGSLNHVYFQSEVPWNLDERFKKIFPIVYHDTPIMKFLDVSELWFSCCASFFVASKQFKIRPRQMYLDMINRLRNYSIQSLQDPKADPSYICGRILEYTWHILLTDKPKIEDRDYTLIDTNRVWSRAPPFKKPKPSAKF